MKFKQQKLRINPTRSLALGFLCLILAGAFLLTLPVCNTKGVFVSPLNALFTATSAVCVTGLVVFDTGTFFNGLGQLVIITLIQLGGLGFMTGAVFMFSLMGRRITLKDRLNIREAVNEDVLAGNESVIHRAVKITFLVEFIGFLLLLLRLVPRFGAAGVWKSFFFAISAFCNAGFDLNGGFSSLTSFANDSYFLLVISFLIISGGLGYAVIFDCFKVIRKEKRPRQLSLNTKVLLTAAAALLAAGTLIFLIAEWSNPKTIGGFSFSQKLVNAFFQSVTTRTAGFNAISQSELTNASSLMSFVLMFIGASSGSTGGGLKTGTFVVLCLCVIRLVKGRESCEIYGRRLPNELVRRTIGIAVIYLFGMITAALLICLSEANSGFSIREILFEVISGIGTVGLSLGITPKLSAAGKIIMCVVMFAGRLGPLSLAIALSGKADKYPGVSYPQDKLMVG